LIAGGFINLIDTLTIPEVLIGENFLVRLRTSLLAPTCADAQVFFTQNSAPSCFPAASHVTCKKSFFAKWS
jgi:hypothetical protein